MQNAKLLRSINPHGEHGSRSSGPNKNAAANLKPAAAFDPLQFKSDQRGTPIFQAPMSWQPAQAFVLF